LTSQIPRCQYVGEADPTKNLGTDAVQNHIDHFRPVLGWIVVHTERSLTKGSIHYLDDSVRNAFSDPRFVRWRTGVRKVVRATSEGAGNDD
jgi:hypothetical protein